VLFAGGFQFADRPDEEGLLMRELFLAAFLGLPFLLFAALSVWRRGRFRNLAAELGGRHVSTGLLAHGAIEGADFKVEVVRWGKSHGTRASVPVRESPGEFLLRAGFFEGSPDWDKVFVRGVRAERVFLWQVRIGGLVRPERAQQQALLDWLPPVAEFRRLRAGLDDAEIDELTLDEQGLSTSFRGIASDATRLRRTLAALRGLTQGRAVRAGGSRAA
jgi:hypothetical protein